MKNVCLCIMVMLFGIFNSHSQDLQNSNWYFGINAGIKFLPNSTTTPISGSQLVSIESCASVSDSNGNLLFYTDGITVWNKNNAIMSNGTDLKSSTSSTQGAVIVPRPGYNNNRYYIVTIDGISGTLKGLYYSEVDMSDGIGYVLPSKKNIPLKDHLGTAINESYNNGSEKLTSTLHSNGNDYWIVTFIRDRIYSYLVTIDGIVDTPAFSAIGPVDLSTSTNDNANGLGCIKISAQPKNLTVVTQRTNEVTEESVMAIGGQSYYIGVAYGTDGVTVGDFNSVTGEVTLGSTLFNPAADILHKAYYGIEFSPSGKVMYFTHWRDSYSPSESKLWKLYSDMSTAPVMIGHSSTGLQRGITNKIYVATNDYVRIGVINNPDDYANPGYDINGEIVSPGGDIICKYGLPQWVYRQPPCVSDLVLTSPLSDIPAGTFQQKKASGTITASNIVNSGGSGVYDAGSVVYLKPGFNAKEGSSFRAYIEGCSGAIALFESAYDNASSEEFKNFTFTLFPNPTIDKVSISYDETITNLMVTSMEGLTMFNQAIGKNAYDLYVANYKKGIYIVTIQTQDGKVLTEKLVKN